MELVEMIMVSAALLGLFILVIIMLSDVWEWRLGSRLAGFFRWLFTNANTERIRNLDRDLRKLEVNLVNLRDSWWSDYEKAEELIKIAKKRFKIKAHTMLREDSTLTIWASGKSFTIEEFKNYLAQKALDKL